ncbi:unnamed protein product [Arctogadus glacialis]
MRDRFAALDDVLVGGLEATDIMAGGEEGNLGIEVVFGLLGLGVGGVYVFVRMCQSCGRRFGPETSDGTLTGVVKVRASVWKVRAIHHCVSDPHIFYNLEDEKRKIYKYKYVNDRIQHIDSEGRGFEGKETTIKVSRAGAKSKLTRTHPPALPDRAWTAAIDIPLTLSHSIRSTD